MENKDLDNHARTCSLQDNKSDTKDNELVFELADFFKIFGDSTRIRILTELDKRELCVCEISSIISMTKSAVSHQLKILKQSNLVKCERRGKHIYYALADSHVSCIIEKAIEHIRED